MKSVMIDLIPAWAEPSEGAKSEENPSMVVEDTA